LPSAICKNEFPIEAIKRALSDPDDSVRTEAKAALARLAPEELTNYTNRVTGTPEK